MKAIVSNLKFKFKQAQEGGRPTDRERHFKQGKLLPRERIDLVILDHPGSPFLNSLS